MASGRPHRAEGTKHDVDSWSAGCDGIWQQTTTGRRQTIEGRTPKAHGRRPPRATCKRQRRGDIRRADECRRRDGRRQD
eukprot:14728404-Alexandrium_andersonii.AAC.1